MFYVIEKIPKGEKFYYFLQKNVTKSLRMTDEKYLSAFDRKVPRHLDAIKKYGNTPVDRAIFFEFGAGWDLLCPLGMSIVGGAKKFICIDINEFMHPEDIYNCLEFYRKNREVLQERVYSQGLADVVKGDFNTRIDRSQDTKTFLTEEYRIEYKAPCDARDTNMESCSVDYVITNTTLQHIPEVDVRKILTECKRIMKDDGFMSVTVSYLDHYANFDTRINRYNFLQYSDKEWKKYSPSLHYQNRLRHSEFKKMFSDLGLYILEETPYKINPSDMEKLESIQLADKYKNYSKEDLVIQGSGFVLKKI